MTGLQFTQDSDTPCGTSTFSITHKIFCDEALTTAPQWTVTQDSECSYLVTTSHSAGCPVIETDIETYKNFFKENQWLLGVIYLVAGPLIGLLGAEMFPWIMAILITLGISLFLGAICLAFGFMETTLGFAISTIVVLGIGVLIGVLVFRKKHVLFGALGTLTGFYAGTFIDALVIQAGYESAWTYWFISVTLAVIGFVVACQLQ